MQLVRGPYIDRERTGELWLALRNNTELIRTHLRNMCLSLVIDETAGVAYIIHDEDSGLESGSFIRKAPLSLYETFLLLFLRERLAQATAVGQRAVVDHEELVDALQPFEQRASTDKAKHGDKCALAIKGLKKKAFLEIAGKGTVAERLRRYEIAPILSLVFAPEEIARLRDTYTRYLRGEWEAIAEETEEDDDE